MLELDIQRFADGKVVIETELDTKNFENGLNKMQSTTNKAGSTIKNIVAGLGITKLISKGMQVISSSIDDATKRFDTLNNFPKVMSNLGVSASDSSKSIKLMSDKLAGLPTTLDQGAMAVQRFTSKNGDVKKSTDIFLALNNAILAGGAGTEIQASALEQLSQSYAKGKMDMMEWRTIQTAMPAQLKQVATAMGVTTEELGEMLREGDNTSEAMEKFMDTIIQLNETGIDGFESFEKQAKNSTSGIRTAITVAKTQVVKGVADMITGMNKALKKSDMPELSQLIAKVGKEAKKQLDNVAKAISKIDFKKLISTIKALIPVVGSLTAGFLAYNGVLKVLQLQQTIANIGKMASSFFSLIPAMNGANAATVALNTSLTVSPIGLIVGAVAGLTAGLYLLSTAVDKSGTSIQDINKSLNDYKNAMDEADNSRQKYLDTHMNELQNTENLVNELDALVDENGKVKAGYEDRVNFILGELNNALGTEMKLNDGVIEGYKDIRNSIADIITQKRAKILLDAEEKKYNTAKDKAVQLEKDYVKAQKEYNNEAKKRNDVLKQIQETYGLTAEQLQSVSEKMYYFDESGKKVNLNFTELGQKLGTINGSLQAHQNELDKARGLYESNRQVINEYEYAMEEFANGNYNAVLQIYEDTTNYQGKTNEETKKNYDARLQILKQHLEDLKNNKYGYNEEMLKSEIEYTQKQIKEIENQQEGMKSAISTGQAKIKKTWNEGLANQLSEITGHNIQFEKTANGHVQAYIDGNKKGAPMTKKQAKKMADDMIKEIEKAKEGSEKGGYNFTVGTDQGIQKGQGKTFNVVNNYGKSILKTFLKSLQERSPSKATKEMGLYFTEGFDNGIDKGKKDTIKGIKEYGEDIIDELSSHNFNSTLSDIYGSMQRAVDLETSRMTANVQTSGTYQMAMAGTPVFNLSDNSTDRIVLEADGRKLAEVVNTHNRNREVAKA